MNSSKQAKANYRSTSNVKTAESKQSIHKEIKKGQNTSIDPAQIQKTFIESAVKSAPARFRKNYKNALEGKAQSKKAIKAKCLECVGFEDGPNRIRNCEAYTCPLWKYRPYCPK